MAKVNRRGCAIIKLWARSISNHFYWSAASSGGDGDLVEAKIASIVNHVADIHLGHSVRFPNCFHEDKRELRETISAGNLQ